MTKEYRWGRHRCALRIGRIAIFLSASFLSADIAFMSTVRADEPAGDFKLGLFVDVLGSMGSATDKGSATGKPEPFQFDIIGMPLSIGSREPDSAVPGLTIGVDGTYKLPIDGAFSVVTTGSVEKTRYLEDEFWGRDRANGQASIQHDHDGLKTALEPGVEVELRAGEVTERRYRIDGRVAKEIFSGLALSTSTGFTRQDAPLTLEDNASFGRARLGLSYQLDKNAKLNLGYDMTQKWADQPQASETRSGPSLGLSLSVFEFLEIGTSYQYCESTSYEESGADLRALVDDVHSVGMNAAWRDPAADYLSIKADYRFDQTASAIASRDGQAHDGMITLGLQF